MAGAWNGLDLLSRMQRFQVGLEFLHVRREVIGAGEMIAAQGLCGEHVGPGSPTQAEIDAIRIKRG